MSTEPEHEAPGTRRVREAARLLALRTHEYLRAVSRATGLHDADLQAVGVLKAAEEQGERLTPGALGRELSLSPAAVSALVLRMERHGHARRSRSHDDARRVLLNLTPSANETSNARFSPLNQEYATCLSEYSEDQRMLVAEVLEKLARATRNVADEVGGEDCSGVEDGCGA